MNDQEIDQSLIDELNTMSDSERDALYFGMVMFSSWRNKATRRSNFVQQRQPSNVFQQQAEPSKPQEYVFKRTSEEERKKLRRSLVMRVWEPKLRAELITRILWLYDQKEIDVNKLIKVAQKTKRETGEDMWKTLADEVGRVYTGLGIEWTKTAPALEPKPDGFDEYQENLQKKRVPITQLLDPDYDPTPEDRTPVAFKGRDFSVGKSLGDIADVKGMEDIRS